MQKIFTLWGRVVEPQNTPMDVYFRAKLLLRAIVIFFFVFIFNVLFLLYSDNDPLPNRIILLILILSISSYSFTKTGFYAIGAPLVIYGGTFIILAISFNSTPHESIHTLHYLVLLTYLSATLLSEWHTIFISIGHLLAIQLLNVYFDLISNHDLLVINVFLLSVSIPSIMVSLYLKRQNRQENQQLAVSRDRYQHLFDSNLLGMLTHDGVTVKLVNDATANIFGYPSAELLIDKPIAELLHPEDAEAVDRFVKTKMLTGEIKNLRSELRVYAYNGQLRYVDTYSSVLTPDNEAAQPQILASFVDITEPKQALANAQRRQIFDGIVRGISSEFIFGRSGNLNNYIQLMIRQIGEFANAQHAFLVLFKEIPDLALKDNYYWHQTQNHNLPSLPSDSFLWAYEHLGDESFEHQRPKTNDAKPYFYEVPINYKGEVLGVVGVCTEPETGAKDFEWDIDTPILLQMVAEIFANSLSRQITEYKLRYHLKIDQIVTMVSANFMNATLNDIPQGIHDALAHVGQFLKAERGYIVWRREHVEIYDCAYEWLAPEALSRQEHFNGITQQDIAFTWSLQQLRKNELYYIENVATLGDDVPTKAEMQDLGIHSQILIPMIYQGQLLGYMAFESSENPLIWFEGVIPALKIMGEIVATSLARQRYEEDLEQHTRTLVVLNEVARVVSHTIEIEPLLDSISQLICQALDATSAYITEVDFVNQKFSVIGEYIADTASEKEQISDRGVQYSLKDSPEIAMFYEGNSNISEWVVHAGDANLSVHDKEQIEEYGAKSVLRSLLISDGEINGILEIWETRHKREFSVYEHRLIQGVASQASAALRRVILYRALQESQRHNARILDALPDLVLRQNKLGVYLDVKANTTADTAKLQPLVGQQPQDTYSDPVAAVMLGYIRAALMYKKIQIFEYQTEEQLHYEARIVPVGDDEVLTFIRNITERKAVQSRELELQLERERVKILENFISDASHDLRTPITNLKSRLYLLQRAKNAEAQARQIGVMESEINRLERLIEDLLTMSQLDGKALNVVPLNITSMIHDIVEANQLNLQKKSLNLELSIAPILPIIEVDANGINRVITNLFVNAIHYTLEGAIRVEAFSHREGIMVRITDTGIGIPDEDLPRIFERFYRADKARNTDRGGTGLGLAIVKKIVELHFGKITVDSQPDVGSTFSVWLPLTQPQ